MAGMGKRGTHSARHRAGRARPDAAAPDAPQSPAGWPSPAPGAPHGNPDYEVRGAHGMARGPAPDADIGYEAMASGDSTWTGPVPDADIGYVPPAPNPAWLRREA